MKYKWGIIGCGHIANEMAEAMKDINAFFYGIYARNIDKAEAFASKHGVSKIYTSLDDMLNDSDIDIIYIATPHNTHIEFLRKAIKAKKHVLCEKAITLNSKELDEAISLAEENNVILAEAMTIFHCPVYKAIDDTIESGSLGKLKTIQVNLGSYKDYDMTNRFFNLSLAGGAMLDIGVYALSFARYFLTKAPNVIKSIMVKAPTGADEQVSIILNNEENEMATVTLSLTSKLPRTAVAAFENGYVNVFNYNRSLSAEIIYTADESIEEIQDTSGIHCLAMEVMDMEKSVSDNKNYMKLHLTKDVMDIMTKVRFEHNMLYPEEL